MPALKKNQCIFSVETGGIMNTEMLQIVKMLSFVSLATGPKELLPTFRVIAHGRLFGSVMGQKCENQIITNGRLFGKSLFRLRGFYNCIFGTRYFKQVINYSRHTIGPPGKFLFTKRCRYFKNVQLSRFITDNKISNIFSTESIYLYQCCKANRLRDCAEL